MKIIKKLVAIVSALAIATTALTTTAFAASTDMSVPYGKIYNACGKTRIETLYSADVAITFQAALKDTPNNSFRYYQNYDHKDVAGVVLVNQTDIDSLYSASMLCQYYNCVLIFADDTTWAHAALLNNTDKKNTFNIFTLSTGKNSISNDVINNIKRYNKNSVKTKVTKITGSNRIDINTKVLNYIIKNRNSNELKNQSDTTICIINQNSYSDIASIYNLASPNDANILYMLVSNKLTNDQKTLLRSLGRPEDIPAAAGPVYPYNFKFFGSTVNLISSVKSTMRTKEDFYFKKIVGKDRYTTNLATISKFNDGTLDKMAVDRIRSYLSKKEIFLVDGTSEVDCLITACTTAICDKYPTKVLLINKSNPKVINNINASLKKANVKTITTNNYNTIKNSSIFIAIGTAGNYAKL